MREREKKKKDPRERGDKKARIEGLRGRGKKSHKQQGTRNTKTIQKHRERE
jgi:hypothetical protein